MNNNKIMTCEDWKKSNIELMKYLIFFSQNKNNNNLLQKNAFLLKRTAIHNRVKEDLKNFLIKINEKKNKIEKELIDSKNIEFLKAEGFIFDEQKNNLKIRIISYLKKNSQKKYIKYLHEKKKFLNLRINQSIEIFDLLINPILSNNYVLTLSEEFFNLNPLNKKIIQIEKLQKKIKFLQFELQNLIKPEWYQNFSLFFSNLINKFLKNINLELFYFTTIPEEISFSRCIFNAHHKSLRPIDNFISRCASTSFSDFSERIIEFCGALIPDNVIKTSQDHSIGLLLYFRLIMDRIYENYSYFFNIDPLYTEYLSIFSFKMKTISLPKQLTFKFNENDLIRNIFEKELIFLNASQELLISYFHFNPIDSLFYIHNTMNFIHKAAISKFLGKEPSLDDLKQILGFDDLFSLFLGIFISSDLPDIYQLFNSISLFTPKTCLSPMFEYSKANLEALVLHIKKNIKKN